MSDYRIRDVARMSCEKHAVTPRPGGGGRGGHPPVSRWVHKEAVRLLAEAFSAAYHGDEGARHRGWQEAWRWDTLTHSLKEANIQARMIADATRDALETPVPGTAWTVTEAALQVQSVGDEEETADALHGHLDFILAGPYGKSKPWAAATLDIKPYGGAPAAWLELGGVLWALSRAGHSQDTGHGVLILAPRTAANRSQEVAVIQRPAAGLVEAFEANLGRWEALHTEPEGDHPTTTPGPHCGACQVDGCPVRWLGKVRL